MTTAARRWIVSLLAVALLAACDVTPAQWKTPNMTALSSRLQPLFEKTRTVCFGRYLIDVPVSVTVAWGRTQIPFTTAVRANEADTLGKRVAELEAELKSKARYPRSEGRNLYDETIGGPLFDQKTVVGQRDFDSTRELRIDSLFSMGPHLVWMDAIPPKKDQSGTVAAMNDTGRRLRPLAENEIPTQAGQCIEHAFLSDKSGGLPLDEEWQRIQIGFRLKEFPDTHLSIEVRTAPQNPEGESLELQARRMDAQPMSAEERRLWDQVKTLRRARRKVNDWIDGFEWLRRIPGDNASQPHHEFELRVNGVRDDPLKPYAQIQLRTGVADDAAGATKPLLSDEEAIALWDRLTGSIRVRPVGGVKTSRTDSTEVVLGELAATGRTCPQTGWWECVDDGDVQGGRRRHFHAGERMPHAVLLGPPSLWQRVKGERPSYRTGTVWKLVGHDKPAGPAGKLSAPPGTDASRQAATASDLPATAGAADTTGSEASDGPTSANRG